MTPAIAEVLAALAAADPHEPLARVKVFLPDGPRYLQDAAREALRAHAAEVVPACICSPGFICGFSMIHAGGCPVGPHADDAECPRGVLRKEAT